METSQSSSTGGSGSTPQFAYGYDRASNLTSITANGPQQSYNYTATNALTIGNYGANGNPTALSGNAYTWDGANRIVGYTSGTKQSQFVYDGLGRLVRIVDQLNGSIVADHAYFWCGAERCLAHDNTQSGSPISTQFFAQGIIASGAPLYYVTDRLVRIPAMSVPDSGIVR